MPILGEGRKYASELAALDKGVRRKPLQRKRPLWLDAVIVFCLAALVVLIVFGAVLLMLATAANLI